MSGRNTLTDTEENKYLTKTGTREIANKKRERHPTDQHAHCITEETKNDILHLSVNSQLLFKPHFYC